MACMHWTKSLYLDNAQQEVFMNTDLSLGIIHWLIDQLIESKVQGEWVSDLYDIPNSLRKWIRHGNKVEPLGITDIINPRWCTGIILICATYERLQFSQYLPSEQLIFFLYSLSLQLGILQLILFSAFEVSITPNQPVAWKKERKKEWMTMCLHW